MDSPEERCELQPRQVCRSLTRLLPRLKEVQECLEVPLELCATSRVNPRQVKRPSLLTWCYSHSQQACRAHTDCPQFSSCQGPGLDILPCNWDPKCIFKNSHFH